MKYLFIVQGEGRGHLTQAVALSGMLRENGHQVVEVLVGMSKNREVPLFFHEKIGTKIRTFDSPSFSFDKEKKHINLAKTIFLNIQVNRLKKFKKSIETIHRRIQKTKPDVVINFYEVLAGLANLRFREEVPFVNIAHQFLIKHPDFAHGKGEEQGMMFLRLHALLCSIGATKTLALSLYPLKDVYRERMAVVPPLLRKEVLRLTPADNDFILGYMLNDGYADEVKEWHKKNPDIKLHFFWDKKDAPKELKIDATLSFHSIDDQKFLEYMALCGGYITTAGFESVCEAHYLGKAIMMIPAHIEQEVNAADAVAHYCGIEGNRFDLGRLLDYMRQRPPADDKFRAWVDSAEEIFIRHLTTLV